MYTIAPFQFGVWKLTCTYSRVQTLLHPEWSKSDDVTYYLFRACRSGSPRRISDKPSRPAVTVLAAARPAPRQAAARKRPGPAEQLAGHQARHQRAPGRQVGRVSVRDLDARGPVAGGGNRVDHAADGDGRRAGAQPDQGGTEAF